LSSLLPLLVASTGVLTAPLAYLALVSGFCLRYPLLVETTTLGFLELGFCSFLHFEVLPVLLALIGSVHVVASAEAVYMKLHGAGYSYRLVAMLYRFLAYVLAGHSVGLAIVWYVARTS
jgi:hypothetical protein